MNTPATDERGYRLGAIDALRGLVIVIMAIDHVRDFFMVGNVQDPMTDPDVSPWLFATRWITHFCAPVFVFLAGTSAGLMAARKTPAELGGFLLKRGLWLIAIEWFVISTGFTFSPFGVPQFGGMVLVPLQVIWAIGASMVVLAGAQFLGRRACLVIGAAMLLAHNLLDRLLAADGGCRSRPADMGGAAFADERGARAVHPDLCLSAAAMDRRDADRIRCGWDLRASALAAEPVLVALGPGADRRIPGAARHRFLRRSQRLAAAGQRGPHAHGFPQHHQVSAQPDVPADDARAGRHCLRYLDSLAGWLKDTLVMFGRVPFAFYVAHFFLIHTLSILLGVAQGFPASDFVAPFFLYPKGYGLGLPGMYLVWILVLAMLYPFCRWVAAVKARRRDWWLSYL